MTTAAETDRRGALRFWLALAAAGLACLAVPAVWLTVPRSFTGETVPEPNGYDNLIAAGRMIEGQAPSKPSGQGLVSIPPAEATVEELRAFVGPNAAALAEARLGLGRATCVRLSTRPLQQAIAENIGHVGPIRALGRLIACAAALAEREGRTVEAADGYADALRLGRAAAFGGLLIDKMMEPAIQWPGVEALNRLAPALPAADARRLAAEVERVDRSGEPAARVFAREKAYANARAGWQMRVVMAVQARTFRALAAPAEASALRGEQRGRASLRLLAATLALRAYRLDHPDAPVPPSLEALVPAYLKAVPGDPNGKGPLRLAPGGDHARVYSVGPNGRDDGGTPPSSPRSGDGDLMLSTP